MLLDSYSRASLGRRLIYVPATQAATVQDCHKLLGDTLRGSLSVGFIVAWPGGGG